MASEIAAVLLIPEDGDPLGLLKGGPCGARPPMAHKVWDWSTQTTPQNTNPRWLPGAANHGNVTHGGVRVDLHRALVLAWDGEPVAEGFDRLCRVAPGESMMSAASLATIGTILHDPPPCPHGAIVLLDADGREVTHAQ